MTSLILSEGLVPSIPTLCVGTEPLDAERQRGASPRRAWGRSHPGNPGNDLRHLADPHRPRKTRFGVGLRPRRLGPGSAWVSDPAVLATAGRRRAPADPWRARPSVAKTAGSGDPRRSGRRVKTPPCGLLGEGDRLPHALRWSVEPGGDRRGVSMISSSFRAWERGEPRVSPRASVGRARLRPAYPPNRS
jgi:hypothetical protein